MESSYDDVKRQANLSSGQVIHAFHKSTACYGEVCPVHNPSDHNLRAYPLHYDFMVASFFREVDGELVIDPDDYNYVNFGKVIVENAIKCTICNDRIVSEHRHDFKYCTCGAVAVDGGSSYLRRLGTDWVDDSKVFTKS